MAALKIREDMTAEDLRRRARKASSGRAAARAHAIANALDGMSRKAAAHAAGMERQALRDAMVRDNGEGLAGLYDRAKGHPPPRLTESQRAALAEVVDAGPDRERDGVSAWTRADLRRWLEAEFSKTYHPSSMSRVPRSLNLSRRKIRPSHPKKDAQAEESFKKGGSANA